LAADFYLNKVIKMIKEIENTNGEYSITYDGIVISNKRNLIMRTRLDRYGYELVTLHVKGKALTRKVHRLVAEAFLENPDKLETVNHIDGIKTNNEVSNLEWMSVGDNHRHAFKTGLHSIGENRKAGKAVKLTNDDVIEIKKLIKNGYSNTEIGKLFGVSCGCIYSIRVGKSWTHI
jgi:hypothetical protein